jgi:predicted RNA-binding Zn ribbon-like protein
MKSPGYNPADEALIGGALCLDFTNTVGSWADSRGTEKLHDYEDLLRWAAHAGALDARARSRLRRLADGEPQAAARVHFRAIAFRNALYAVLRSHIGGLRPAAAQLALLNREFSALTSSGRLISEGERFAWRWGGASEDLAQLLWPVAQSAAGLLTSGDLKRVGHCVNEECGWLFIDSSRNGRRRWCSMRDCGNRAKVNRFNARRREKNTNDCKDRKAQG